MGVLVILIALFFVLNFKERYAVKSIVDEENKRHLAGLVAEEFRIKSRDLTRYARSYCATENPVYYDRYVNILQWSRGEITRPDRLGGSISGRFKGKKISHREILDEIGLSPEEKEYFRKAESLSNTLAEYELQAMESVKLGKIVSGPLEPFEGETVPQFANRAIYGESYHEQLDKIAESTDVFLQQYQMRADALFDDYQNVFSLGLLTQFLVQIALVAFAVFLVQYMLIQAKRQQDENRWLMLDAMPIGCMVRDRNFKLISCNREVLRMLGLKDTKDAAEHFFEKSPEYQPNGKKSTDYAHEMQINTFENGFSQFRWIHLNEEGKEFPADVTIVRINLRNEDFAVVYTRDVSGEEAAAREIINSEARILAYQEAGNRMLKTLNAIPVGIALFDENFNLEDCNNIEMQLFGVDSKEELREKFASLSPAYQPNGRMSRELMLEKFSTAAEKGAISFEWMHKKIDGTIVPTQVNLTRVNLGDRTVLVTCNRDLTEEKKMQAEVARANERIRLMFDTTPLCCTLIDEDFRGIDCNREAVKLFGMSNKDEYLSNFEKIFPEFQPDGIRSAEFFGKKVKEAFEKGRVTFEAMTQNIQEEEIPAEIVFIPLLMDESPTLAGYARDLRERKLLEKTEMLSEIKMQFFANMSHEIRTPMNAIVALSGLLMEEKLGKKQRHYVADIKSSADTLLTLINDLLDLSKLEAGKMQLVPKDFNFNELIDHITSTLGFAALNKGLQFVLEKNGDVPEYLFGDNVRIKQILWNLIGNAIKFTETGSVKLAITDLGEQLRFDVIDTGIGIREADMPSLFEAFMQVDQQKTSHIQGTGLGLGISKSIVAIMGGEITVSSAYEKGTTFSFTIPKTVGDPSRISDYDSDREQIVESTAKILVVDDNEINLNVATGVFGSLGIAIDIAFSGKEAIQMVREIDYDIVFMDHMMPDMDGIEATEKIRRMPGDYYRKLPIIALTANAVSGMKEMFLDKGLDDFLPKPIDTSKLNSILEKWVPQDKQLKSFRSVLPKPSVREEVTLSIDGIDVEKGLSFMSGGMKEYMTILGIFRDEGYEKVNQIGDACDNCDFKRYTTFVHAVKSSAASIGATRLSSSARSLETAGRMEDLPLMEAGTRNFLSEYMALLENIGQALGKTKANPPVTGGQYDGEKRCDDFTRLKEALEKFDAGTIDSIMSSLQGVAWPEDMADDIASLSRNILMFEYEEAAVIIDGLLEKH